MLDTPSLSAPTTLIPLAAARTTGNQTIARSELYAVVKVVEGFDKAAIFTDSQSTVNVFHRCLKAVSLEDLQDLSNRDLVFRLWEALGSGEYSINKLRSHVDVSAIEDPLARYNAWGNVVADRSAVEVCKQFMPDYVGLVEGMHTDIQTAKEDLFHLYHLHLKLHKHRATLHAALDRQHTATITTYLTQEQQVALLVNWRVAETWTGASVTVDMTWASAWGPRWAASFKAWCRAVVWPVPEGVSEEDPGVTFAELVLSFCWFSGFVLPVKRAKADGVDYLVLPDSVGALQSLQVQLGELSNLFSVFIRQMEHLTLGQWLPTFAHGACKSLYCIGARTQAYGLLKRPQFPFAEEVMQYLSIQAQKYGEKLSTHTLECDVWNRTGEPGFLDGKAQLLASDLTEKWSRKMRKVQTESSKLRNQVKEKNTLRSYFGS
eukprot:Skav226386  [mRNA]  locus=scaffold1028:16782:18080:+ [translate_table: standard]